jgi:hypothetical protein
MQRKLTSVMVFMLLVLAVSAAFAQSNPLLFIRPTVLPANPTVDDQVRLNFYASTSFQGYRLNTSFIVNGHQMTFNGCYQVTNSTVMSRFIDSVNVGRLPVGTYTVSFIGAMLGQGQTCTSGLRDTVSLTFQVRGALATKRAGEGWAVYPTPATGGALSLLIPSDKKVNSVTLFDALGRSCYVGTGGTLQQEGGSYWRLSLPALPTGAYTLRLGVTDGAAVSQRVLLE